MTYTNFIPESQACELAGVSINTLLRFAETGYLQIERDSAGIRLFCRPELEQLFGLSQEAVAAATEDLPEEEVMEVADQMLAAANGDIIASEDPVPTPSAKIAPFQKSRSAPAGAGASRGGQLEHELLKFKNIVNLQERLLDARERELDEIKREREWLRTRIERLEEKTNRDQILLLSERQMMQKLIGQQEPKRSPLHLALEWLGFVEPEEKAAGAAIEVEMRAGRKG